MNAVDNIEIENITIRNGGRRLMTTADNVAISNIRISGFRMCDTALGGRLFQIGNNTRSVQITDSMVRGYTPLDYPKDILDVEIAECP